MYRVSNSKNLRYSVAYSREMSQVPGIDKAGLVISPQGKSHTIVLLKGNKNNLPPKFL